VYWSIILQLIVIE